jgi:HK97 family phage portal protein
MRIRRKRDGFVQMTGFKVQFFAPYGAGFDDNGNTQAIRNPIGGGTPNEVIHLSKYSPTSGYYGVPDILAAQQAIAGNEFAARYNLDYFENKAVPRYAIILKGATLSPNAEESLLSFFETSLKGQNHRSIFIPLPGDSSENKVSLDFEAIETGNQDSSFVNYKKSNTDEILLVHRVPISKISISANASLAIARDADKTFSEQVCAPEQRMLEQKLRGMVLEITDAFEFALNEQTLTDADTQSKIDERNVKAGIDLPNEIRATRGKPAVKGGNERVDLNAKANSAAAQAKDGNANRARNSQRSAAASDSAGEARQPKGEGRASP